MGCKIFASELGSKLGVIRGFQKGITLGSRASVSVYEQWSSGWVAQQEIWCWHSRKYGGVGCSIIVSLQSSLEFELGVRSLDFEFGVGLDFDWTSA